MLRRCSVMSREWRASFRIPTIASNTCRSAPGSCSIFQRVVERQLQVGDARRLIERQQRPAVGQRHQANAGLLLERRRRTHRDDGVPAENRQLGERARTLPRPPLHQLDDGLADVLVHSESADSAHSGSVSVTARDGAANLRGRPRPRRIVPDTDAAIAHSNGSSLQRANGSSSPAQSVSTAVSTREQGREVHA